MFIGTKAPVFLSKAVMGNGEINDHFSLYDYRDGKYCILYFYPGAFTYVCPTDLIALDKKMKEFNKCNAVVACISVDSVHTLAEWRNRTIKEGGIGPINIPLISDIKKNIASHYGLINEDGICMRAIVIIDESLQIQYYAIYHDAVGIGIDELLRIISALQFVKKTGKVCPSGWMDGHAGLDRNRAQVTEYLRLLER